jgi:hypothetical protein
MFLKITLFNPWGWGMVRMGKPWKNQIVLAAFAPL